MFVPSSQDRAPLGLDSILSGLALGGQPQGNLAKWLLPTLQGLPSQKHFLGEISPDLRQLISALGRNMG